MPDISMLDLRANLTDVLRRVADGESFTVVRFGSPVASIEPFKMPPLDQSSELVDPETEDS